MDDYYDYLEDDDYFKCPLCDLSHHDTNGIVCDYCDTRYCKYCYEIHEHPIEDR